MFVRALDLLKRRTGVDGNGELAAMMATSYLATTTHEDEGGLAADLENVIGLLEKAYGVKLAVVPQEPVVASSAAPSPAVCSASASASPL